MASAARRRVQAAPTRILVATDFSPPAAAALAAARGLAAALHAEIVLLHVTASLVEVARSDVGLEQRRLLAARLQREARTLRRQGVRVRFLVRTGSVAECIVDTAAEEDAGLIVIGTRGRSAVVGAVLGGVAYDVVRKARCPVLTVRAARTEPPHRRRARGR